MRRYLAGSIALLAAATSIAPTVTRCTAQSTQAAPAQPGFNLFSVAQDVEIGRQSAAEAEKQLVLLNDPALNRYLNRVVQRLAAVAPGARYPYTIKAVNAPEINAFALPGGPMYVNRGLLEAARSEAELAGVLAHEMSHVALRHGTSQASTAYLARGGLGILGGLLGRSGGNAASIINTIGGIGLNTAFLQFSRTAEYQADATGASIMARAGYNPSAMADFFDVLRAQQGRDPSSVEQFFSDHPGVAERAARVRQIASATTVTPMAEVGGFSTVKAGLGQSSSSVATSQPGRLAVPAGQPPVYDTRTAVQVAAPSARFVRYVQPGGFLTINYPANWNVAQTSGGTGMAIAPQGGVVQTNDGQQHVVYGVIFNHYAPFISAGNQAGSNANQYVPFEGANTPANDLNAATDDLVNTIERANPYLRAEPGSARPESISGSAGYSVLLAGTSPVTGQEEQATLFTRSLPDGHVVYALAVAPAANAADMNRVVVRMMRSLVVNDAAGHRAVATRAGRLRLGARQQP